MIEDILLAAASAALVFAISELIEIWWEEENGED